MIPIVIKNFGINLNTRVLLKDVSLEIRQGTTTIIKGKTGSGKSVLLKALVGILPQSTFTFEGTVKINGIDSYIQGEKQALKKWNAIQKSGLLYIPAETAQTMNPSLTLEQNLHQLAPQARDIVRKRLEKYFNLDFNLFSRLYPDEISGGEMQRIALMMLLSRKGNIILLDEPTVNLDRNLRKKLIEFLNNEIINNKDITILIVTHDIDFIKNLSNTQIFELKESHISYLPELPNTENYEKKENKNDMSKFNLELKNISQSYIKRGILGETRYNAFLNLNLNFNSSKIYGITGPSGCGKSTMLKSILRLINDTEGKILFEENDFIKLKQFEDGEDTIDFIPYRKRMVIVQQDSRFSFFPDIAVKESYRQITKINNSYSEKELIESLIKVGLTKQHLDLCPASLSSGEMKRIDLARAISAKPDILLLDEPFAFIDFETRNKIMNVILDYIAEHPAILILVTHEDFDLKYFVEENFDFIKTTNNLKSNL